MKPAAIGARRGSVLLVDDPKLDSPEHKASQASRQVIHAELSDSDACSAVGMTVRQHLRNRRADNPTIPVGTQRRRLNLQSSPRQPAHSLAYQLAVLELRAEVRAYLWAIGEIDTVLAAVDPLQEFAVKSGLVRHLGQDQIQKILADIFARFFEDAP